MRKKREKSNIKEGNKKKLRSSTLPKLGKGD
jgi:hypothetical protein